MECPGTADAQDDVGALVETSGEHGLGGSRCQRAGGDRQASGRAAMPWEPPAGCGAARSEGLKSDPQALLLLLLRGNSRSKLSQETVAMPPAEVQDRRRAP